MNLSVLWVLALTSAVASSCWKDIKYGILLPRDSGYHIGEDVKLRCFLNESSIEVEDERYPVNSSMITFNSSTNNLRNSDIVLNSNEEATVMIKNGQPGDGPMYSCSVHVNGKKVLLCTTLIYFGYPPENVTNFKCRSYNWSNLTCTWTPPPNPVNVTYNLTYGPVIMPRTPCPLDGRSSSSCLWSLNSHPPYIQFQNKFLFILTGSNDLGTNPQKFYVDHYNIVVPGMPAGVTAVSQGSTYINLTILPPAGFRVSDFEPGVCYRVKYKSNYHNQYLVLDAAKNESWATLTGLYPNTWYSVSVQGRSCSAKADVEPDLWGPSYNTSFKTYPDVPQSPPEALVTYFDVVNRKYKRSVTVYWKRLEQKFQNGDKFQYRVSIMDTFLNRRRRSTGGYGETNVSTNVSTNHKTFDLDLESSYVVSIWSLNDKGLSQNYTKIEIPKARNLPARPLHVRPVLEGHYYEINWEAPSTLVGGYTLVWCQGEPRCNISLESMEVKPNMTKVYLRLPSNNNYDFGIAAKSADERLGSGLEWAPCTVHRTRVVDRVSSVRLDNITPHSIRVNWKLACDAQKEVVTQYQIYQCSCSDHTCMGNISKSVDNSQAESVVFDNLKPFTDYGFSVVAKSLAGTSLESKIVCGETSSDAPEDAPHDIVYSDITNTTAKMSWLPPKIPNGNVNTYKISVKEVLGRVGVAQERTVPYNVTSQYSLSFNYTLRKLKCFTKYNITVSACVSDHCSPPSNPVYLKTSIGVPGPMEAPRTSFVNSTHVRVSWKAPEEPNGPLDLYLLHWFKREADNLTLLDLKNVTGTSVLLPSGCRAHVWEEREGTHLFSVQALNMVNDYYLYGPISNTTETTLCFLGTDINSTFVIGVIVGSTLALAVIIFVLFSMVRWMKTKLDKMKDVPKVILPTGLQEPHSNSYETFKKGLAREGSDPNLSPKLGYNNRDPDSFPDDQNGGNNPEDSFKYRHGSGASHFSASSTDELICKPTQGGQVTAPRSSGQKMNGKGERNPSGDSSSGHDSISSSLTHRTNLSTDGSTEANVPGRDQESSRDSGLDEESNGNGSAKPHQNNKPHYLPTSAYSKLGLSGGGSRIGDYFPMARGRHLSLYGQNLANSEPSITDLNQEPYQRVPLDPPSPDVPYSKFGMSHSVTDLMLEGMELPDSPLSSQPSPQETLPYSRFGLTRTPTENQKNPYVTMGMALLMGPQKNPNQLLASKTGPPPLVLQSPSKKKQPAEVGSATDQAYSKFALGSATEPEVEPQKIQPYLTMKQVRENENNYSLPDLTVSNREESPSRRVLDPVQLGEPSKNGYLPHQLISSVAKIPEPALPDLVSCNSVPSLSAVIQEMPEVKVQGNSGYVSLNQVLADNTNV